MDAAETVTDAVRQLAALGYTDDLFVEPTGIRCEACGAMHEPERLVVTHTFRFEGLTDPGDEAIVLGVECPACGTRAIVVSAYGPEADPELFAMIARLGG
jgi:DNA-directed RNA polymerase subunit RPC12/RpoP